MTGRDRLRELLDAVLDEDNQRLDDMARRAYASRFHFSREVARGTGETPVAMRRRVMLERSAWRLSHGCSVTDAAFEAGYESVEGFSRAFSRAYGVAPSAVAASGDVRAHWLSAPNGVHFHPPLNLWIHDSEEGHPMHVSALLLQHDLDDTTYLIDRASTLAEEDYRKELLPGETVLSFDGEDSSVAAVLEHQVFSKQVWVAAFEGTGLPDRDHDDPASLRARHEAVAPRWLAVCRDIEQRQAWDDTLVDALCDPPESFQVGSVVAHVVSFGAHRRQLLRSMLRRLDVEVDEGDPIMWQRKRYEA